MAVSLGKQIATGAGKIFAGTLASRVLGFVRELLTAHYFGARAAVDIFNIAFMIPNLLRGALGEHAVESSVLPVFRSMTTQGRVREAWRTCAVALNWLIMILVVASAVTYLFAPQIINEILGRGFAPEQASEAVRLGRLMAPFMVLIGIIAFGGALLLAHRKFLAYGMAPSLFNVGWIGTIILFHGKLGTDSLAYGVLAGGVMELLAIWYTLHRAKKRGEIDGGIDLRAGFSDPYAQRIVCLAGPVCAAAMVQRCASMLDRAIASFLEEGSISALHYSMTLLLMPFALFALSIGRSVFVPLAERAAEKDGDGFRKNLIVAIRLGMLILIPCSVGTVLLATPLARIFQSGRFGPEETKMAATALVCYGVGLASMGFVSIFSRSLHALQDTKTPLRISIMALSINALLSAALALTPLRHGGIALATSVAVTFEATFLFINIRKKIRGIGAEGGFRELLKPAARILFASAVMAAAVVPVNMLCESALPHTSFIMRMLGILIPSAAGAAVFAAVIFMLDREDVRRFLRKEEK